MVHLIENYYALPNNMGFTLAVDKGKTDKEGNKIYDTIGYCGSFEETICRPTSAKWIIRAVRGSGDNPGDSRRDKRGDCV